jgi:hypothetical protein
MLLLLKKLHQQLQEHWHQLLLLELCYQQPAQQLLPPWLELPGPQHQAAAAAPRADAPPKP